MLQEKFTLADDFPATSYEDWRAVVEKDLKGAPFEKKLVTHSYEGFDVQPVYTLKDDPGHRELPGASPFTRGSQPLGGVLNGWELRQEYSHPDLDTANQAILADLAGGTKSLLLNFDEAARMGIDPDDPQAASLVGDDGLTVFSLPDFDQLLGDVHVELVGIHLKAGAAYLPAASMLAAVWKQRGVTDEQAQGAFAADPLGTLAEMGQLPYSIEAAMDMLGELAAWTADRYPQVTSIGVDTSVYHHAGATAAQDVAFALATATEYLRAVTAGGLPIDQAAKQFQFSFSVGTHHFLSLAKLRAARRLWARVVEASDGAPDSGGMRILARTSDRVLTRRDPYVNLLRNTVAMFAAGLGGADAVCSVPFDALNGFPDEFSRRVARNTVLILQDEAHLNRVVDPAGGSWFLETLTDQVAEKAWEVFQDVERQGGMCAALQGGSIANQIDSAFAPRAKDIAKRKDGITGVSEFPNLAEEPLAKQPVDIAALRQQAADRTAAVRKETNAKYSEKSMDDLVAAAAAGATIGQLASVLGFHSDTVEIAPIEAHSFAEPFEELRDASDVWQAKHGQRPRVFLVPMGPVAHHTARLGYSKNFFEAGGFEAVVGEGFEKADVAAASFRASGASIAVICSSDKLYPELIPALVPQLKAAGARTVVLAGNPGENEANWREAGVDRFIYIKCDVLATLRELLAEEGVIAK